MFAKSESQNTGALLTQKIENTGGLTCFGNQHTKHNNEIGLLYKTLNNTQGSVTECSVPTFSLIIPTMSA